MKKKKGRGHAIVAKKNNEYLILKDSSGALQIYETEKDAHKILISSGRDDAIVIEITIERVAND